VITRGVADALRIGCQNRPRIVDRSTVLPEPPYERVSEVDERVIGPLARGNVLVIETPGGGGYGASSAGRP
jgi:N-methylhydantoinase A/oxoprolinase/acetone carboxylase beta subunit